ncbi:MAG: cytochrome c biogenesis protein CcsA [Gemmataceae bacterium]
MPDIQHVTALCFGASYLSAFTFEVLYYFRPRPIFRLLALGFGSAGLFAHTLFLIYVKLLLASPSASAVAVGWILSIFYLTLTIRRSSVPWGLFVLPILIGLTTLSVFVSSGPEPLKRSLISWLQNGENLKVWPRIHGMFLLGAAVGISVAFFASVMYLIQAARVKAKVPPQKGMKLLSLERLEMMNRRAITCSFPLLTLGLLVALWLASQGYPGFVSFGNWKLLTLVVLWIVFTGLLYLLYKTHASGRSIALWTIVAFALMVLSLASSFHPLVRSGGT